VSSACPYCAAPLSGGIARCDECQLAIDWTQGAARAHHPFIRPGDCLLFCDAARGPLPGRELLANTLTDGTRYEATPQGALVTVTPQRSFEAFEQRLRTRDACVRASFLAIDPGVTVACMGRLESIAEAKIKYVLELDPARQRFSIDRGFSSTEVAQFTPLVPWTPCPAAAPIGHVNILELRLQGPTLEARVNDRHVATIHDPVLGIGASGLRVTSPNKSTTMHRAVVQWFEIRGVVA
jgi:hypothetical protein